MSNTLNQVEASNSLQKKMRECNACKDAGFPNQFISFEKIGEDPTQLEKIFGNQLMKMVTNTNINLSLKI